MDKKTGEPPGCDSKKMTMGCDDTYLTAVGCPHCKTVNIPYTYETVFIDNKDLRLGLNNCKKCDLNYVSPRLSEKGLSFLYDKSYRDATVSGQYNISKEISMDKYLVFKNYIKRYSNTNRWKVLDIGCGVGNLIELLGDLEHIDAEGAEFSEYAYSCARDNGLNVRKGDLLELYYDSCSFDCVTCIDVLEHVSKPKEILEKIYLLLRSGGYLMVAVPNLRYLTILNKVFFLKYLTGRKKTLYPHEHLQNYTPATIENLIRSAGFTIVHRGITPPMKIGTHFFRLIKKIAWLPFFIAHKVGCTLGGIIIIARKQEKE